MTTKQRTIAFIDGFFHLNGALIKKQAKKEAEYKRVSDEVDRELFGNLNRDIIENLTEELETLKEVDVMTLQEKKVITFIIEELHHQPAKVLKRQALKASTRMHVELMPKNYVDAKKYLATRDVLDMFIELTEE